MMVGFYSELLLKLLSSFFVFVFFVPSTDNHQKTTNTKTNILLLMTLVIRPKSFNTISFIYFSTCTSIRYKIFIYLYINSSSVITNKGF